MSGRDISRELLIVRKVSKELNELDFNAAPTFVLPDGIVRVGRFEEGH